MRYKIQGLKHSKIRLKPKSPPYNRKSRPEPNVGWVPNTAQPPILHSPPEPSVGWDKITLPVAKAKVRHSMYAIKGSKGTTNDYLVQVQIKDKTKEAMEKTIAAMEKTIETQQKIIKSYEEE